MSSNVDVCRVCQEDEEESGIKLLKPCKCNSYIHKECLLKWTKTKVASDIIDFKNDLNCEICKTNIEYSHPEQDDPKIRMDTSWDLLKLIYERNKNNIAFAEKVFVAAVIPLLVIYKMLNYFLAFINTQRWNYTINAATKKRFKGTKDEHRFITHEYIINYECISNFLPLDSWSYYQHLLMNFSLICASFLPVFFNIADGFDSSVFYKIYEYEFGPERAAEEYKKEISREERYNQIYETRSAVSKSLEVLIYAASISLIIFLHSLMQEFVPRYLFNYAFGKNAQEYDYFFSVYYNFALFSLLYAVLLVTKRRSYKAFILKYTVKLIIVKYWMEILLHLVEVFARKYCKIDSLFNFSIPWHYSLFQTHLTAMSTILSICDEAINYMENNIFRNGVFYLFHLRINITEVKKSNTLLIQPLYCSLRKSLRNVIMMIIAFLGIGGFGLYMLPKENTPIFPVTIVVSGMSAIIVKNVVSMFVNSYADILKIFIYLPVFHKLASILRLSNYLFSEDNINEKGKYTFRDTVDLKDIEQTTKAKETNNEILSKPCFSQREADALFKTGDSSINAYFIQAGYKIKAPNEFTDNDFEKGLMEKVIVKEDKPMKEEKLDTAGETKSLEGLYRYVQGVVGDYDFCFVPQNYKGRLVFFFVTIAIVQNFVVIALFEMSNIFGSLVLFRRTSTPAYRTASLSSEGVTAIEYFKFILGLSIILVFGKLSKKKQSTTINTRIKSFAVQTLKKTLGSILIFSSAMLSLLFAFFLTYLHTITATTIFGIIPYAMEHNGSRIFWFPKPLYLNTVTLFYFFFSGIIIGVVTLKNYYSIIVTVNFGNPENSHEMRLQLIKDYFRQMYTLVKKPLLIPLLFHNLLLLTIYSYSKFPGNSYRGHVQERRLIGMFPNGHDFYDPEEVNFSFFQRLAFMNMDLAALDLNNYWSKIFRVSLIVSVGYIVFTETSSYLWKKLKELKAILRNKSISEEDLIIIEK